MCYDENGDLERRIELQEETQDRISRVTVEVAGRLVREQQLRLRNQRARDGYALPLPSGQFLRAMPGPFAEPDTLQALAASARRRLVTTPR